MNINEQKQALRREIVIRKRDHTPEALAELSAEALSRLEATQTFQSAACIALYYALPGEVQTADFVERWHGRKRILLPIVQGDDLVLRPYAGSESLHKGAYDIWEPSLDDRTEATVPKPDLIIVPGIAFDRRLNRLGRGRGYYDRLLSDLTLPCIGLAFSFQLFDQIPVDTHDRRMTAVVTDREVLGDI